MKNGQEQRKGRHDYEGNHNHNNDVFGRQARN